MDELTLPVLPPTTTLKAALDLLRLTNRTALVTQVRGRATVLDSTDLIVSGRSGNVTLGVIESSGQTVAVDTVHQGIAGAVERALDETGAMIGIADQQEGIATVFTRHADIARVLRLQISFCCCKGPDRHVWAPGDLATPGICDTDGFPVECT